MLLFPENPPHYQHLNLNLKVSKRSEFERFKKKSVLHVVRNKIKLYLSTRSQLNILGGYTNNTRVSSVGNIWLE